MMDILFAIPYFLWLAGLNTALYFIIKGMYWNV